MTAGLVTLGVYHSLSGTAAQQAMRNAPIDSASTVLRSSQHLANNAMAGFSIAAAPVNRAAALWQPMQQLLH